MMKKIKNLLFLFIAMPYGGKAQTSLPYSTGFDNDAELAGWSYQEAGSICGAAHSNHYWSSRNLIHATSSPNAMHHDYEVGYEGTELTEDWVYSPNFNFEGGARIAFKINVYAIAGIQPEDDIKVYLVKSNDAGLILESTLLTSLRDLCDSDFNSYIDTFIDIVSTEGDNSHIAFKYESVNNWFTVAIDDFNVTSAPSSISKINDLSAEVTVYPNPARDIINISYNKQNLTFDEVHIRDITGRLVKSIPFGNIIKVDDLPDNMYSIELISEKGIATKQVIITK